MSGPPEVDSTIPRAKAVFHALLPAAAFLAGPPAAAYILVFTGLAMALSVWGGARWSIFGRFYKQAIAPAFKIAPGSMQDARPHRFAEAVGAIFLFAAAAAYAASATVLAGALALVVVALAALNASAGLCIGCQMYLLLKRLHVFGNRQSSGAA